MRESLRPHSFWGKAIRKRIALQLKHIRHWKIEQKSYEEVENREATWFIDPPYYKSGNYYRYNQVDYEYLAQWCQGRKGQVIVCEQAGADWLPFMSFRTIKTTEGKHGKAKGRELVWNSDGNYSNIDLFD
jgi:site-specific DNA-adenine methylase